MKCKHCGFENRSSVQFCEECGRAMGKTATKACPTCGHANRPEVQYCEECGNSLSQSRLGLKPVKSKLIKAGITSLVVIILAALGYFGLDRLQYPVSKMNARSKADAVVQAYYPELSDVAPQVNEYEDENGESLTSYSYNSIITAKDESGSEMQFTIGAVIIVDRKTGKVEVITIH